MGGCRGLANEEEDGEAEDSFFWGEGRFEKDDIHRGGGPGVFREGKILFHVVDSRPDPITADDMEIGFWGGRGAARAEGGGRGVNMGVLVF